MRSSVNIFHKIFANNKKLSIFAPRTTREISSAGSEHLPYKQGVTGSNPVSPTKKASSEMMGLFFESLFVFIYFSPLPEINITMGIQENH